MFAEPPEAHIVKSANRTVPAPNRPVTGGIVHHLADQSAGSALNR